MTVGTGMQILNKGYEIVCVKYQKLVQYMEQTNMSKKVYVEVVNCSKIFRTLSPSG